VSRILLRRRHSLIVVVAAVVGSVLAFEAQKSCLLPDGAVEDIVASMDQSAVAAAAAAAFVASGSG